MNLISLDRFIWIKLSRPEASSPRDLTCSNVHIINEFRACVEAGRYCQLMSSLVIFAGRKLDDCRSELPKARAFLSNAMPKRSSPLSPPRPRRSEQHPQDTLAIPGVDEISSATIHPHPRSYNHPRFSSTAPQIPNQPEIHQGTPNTSQNRLTKLPASPPQTSSSSPHTPHSPNPQPQPPSPSNTPLPPQTSYSPPSPPSQSYTADTRPCTYRTATASYTSSPLYTPSPGACPNSPMPPSPPVQQSCHHH